MKTFSIDQAKENLDEILEHAKQGGTVFIVGENGEAYELVATIVPKKGPRKAGSARGRVKMADDFDAPLPEFEPYLE